jgi:hypothetical protein
MNTQTHEHTSEAVKSEPTMSDLLSAVESLAGEVKILKNKDRDENKETRLASNAVVRHHANNAVACGVSPRFEMAIVRRGAQERALINKVLGASPSEILHDEITAKLADEADMANSTASFLSKVPVLRVVARKSFGMLNTEEVFYHNHTKFAVEARNATIAFQEKISAAIDEARELIPMAKMIGQHEVDKRA